jgi:Undecaprenyl-phosphate glucose phosphotransferase
MIRRRLNFVNFILRLATMLLPLFAFVLAGYIRFFSGLFPATWSEIDFVDYFGLLFFTTIIWAVVSEHYGLLSFNNIFAEGGSFVTSLLACGVTYAAVMGATFFYRSASFSRLFVALSAGCLAVLVPLAEKLFRYLMERVRREGTQRARLLIIGTDSFAQKTVEALMKKMVMPLTVAAYVRLPDQPVVVNEAPVIEMEDLQRVKALHEIDDVVIALPTSQFAEIPRIMMVLDNFCVPTRAILDFGDGVLVREMLFEMGGLRFLDLRASPSESVVYFVAKRTFDIVFAGLALLILSPVMGVVALAVRLTSPGPAFFRQERVGLNGKLFRMLKFRTMRVGDPTESATRWTVENDPRRTRVGSFLRRTNLDELPQFINVLKGEMSIVGPRPERPHFVQQFLEEVAQYNVRHYLKVGITGWAQVNGWRGDTSIPRRIEHDLYYLRNWSFSFDLKIIALTIWRTFFANRNAY